MKRMICALLCVLMLCGCAGQTEKADVTVQPTTEIAAIPTTQETTEPMETQTEFVDDGRINLYYDDCLTAEELIGTEALSVEIRTEEVTSRQGGTQNADPQVLTYNAQTGRFYAVGTGLATVVADGTEYPVRVSAAPISLFMIIGHSLGAGSTGVPAQSVKCVQGQAYSTTLRDFFSLSECTGIGYGAAVRPSGIDALTTQGGTQGEDSGIAWQWNQRTGEKAWVLNAAVGGSCLPDWVVGEDYFQRAVTMFVTAQLILGKEVAAGHYRLENVAVLYHSAANFEYKGVTFTGEMGERCYGSMLDGLNEAMLDIDGDGAPETLDALGFVPCWTPGSGERHEYDKPANYYMGASDAYPQMFVASMATRSWRTNQDIQNNFPQFSYSTHAEQVAMPLSLRDVFSDGVHLTQVAYNAVGMDIADHLYAKLRSHVQAQSVTVLTEYLMDTGDNLRMNAGIPTTLILLPEPFDVSDLTITVSDGLELGYPFTLRAAQPGSYTLTVSQGGTVLKTLSVTVE